MIAVVSNAVASIPSPSFNTVGPFSMYGLSIGLGIVACTLLVRKRMIDRRIHGDTAPEMLVWVVPAGIIGARMYHVITDWKPIGQWHEIWKGGLGIPGGIALGAVAGLLFIKHRGLPRAKVADAIAPGIPLAQAFGRVGNWWNQELYGGPTELAWGLEIDSPPAEYAAGTLFHPTFLYELLWNLGIVVLLIWIDRRKLLKPGKLIWVYTGAYAIGRLWIESLRIDPATEIAGVRINIWMMSLVLIVSLLMLRNARRSGSASTADDDNDGDDDDDLIDEVEVDVADA